MVATLVLSTRPDLNSSLMSYHRIIYTWKSFVAWDGEEELGGALAIVVHTAYHLGEIRQALCTIQPSNSQFEPFADFANG